MFFSVGVMLLRRRDAYCGLALTLSAVRRLAASETSDVESVMMAIHSCRYRSRNDRGLGVTWIACDMHFVRVM